MSMGTERLNRENFHTVVGELILGASSSLDLAVNVGFGFSHTLSQLCIEDVLALADSRLVLRCVLGLPLKEQESAPLGSSDYASLTEQVLGLASQWETKVTGAWRGNHIIIVDGRAAVVSRPTSQTNLGQVMFTDHPNKIRVLFEEFDDHWREATAPHLLYNDELATPGAEEQSRLLITSRGHWDRLFRSLAQNPEDMRSMKPREFEELVAELLVREGLEVSLTPQSRDGGRDILAYLDTVVGRHLYLIECKRFAPNHRVGVELVRQLYGVLELERATAGMLVTTSSFTLGARHLQRDVCHRLELRDYEDLVSWLMRSATA